MRHHLLGIVAITVVAGMSWMLCAQQPNRKGMPGGVTAHRDLEYVKGGHFRQKLDLFLPKQADTPLPVIVWIHGGAWEAGSKEQNPMLSYLGKGYAVASINYRLSQHAVFPAQIEDCKAALRWLRANAKTYHLNPDKIGVSGGSAGGHLVALLGTTSGSKAFAEKGENLEQSSQVQCVVDFYGPTDFRSMGGRHGGADSPVARLLGGAASENKEKAVKASPATYISEACPPFLVIHGDKDNVVPYTQSTTFVEALKKAGVDATLILVKEGGHGGPAFMTGENGKQIERFFEKHLKGSESEKKQEGATTQVEKQGAGRLLSRHSAVGV